jgi:uncharacterized protein (TIGR00255 family)
VDVKSVNHRYFAFQARLPQNLQSFEGAIQAVAKNHLSRGQVSVFASWDQRSGFTAPVSLNMEAARQAVASLRTAAAELGLKGDVEIAHLLAFPAVFAPGTVGLSSEELWEEAKVVFDAAMKDLDSLRLREGEDLVADAHARLDTMLALAEELRKRSPEVVAEQKAKLERRIAELCSETVDAQKIADRITLEVVVFADRCDVTEELVRMASHIAKFRELLRDGKGVGRKLDFLTQEMNREANTIGSKTPDAEAARQVVEMKSEIERIREQIQNIE